VNKIKLCAMFSEILQGVGLMKLKRVSWLWLYINANNIEARTGITHTCPASTTK
jgi:hypothetical protein